MSNPGHGIDTRYFERFGLEFLFSLSNGDHMSIFLPFFQNPKISESKKANYVKFLPIATNDNVLIYTGSESRKIKIEFDINFLHMVENNLISLKNMKERLDFPKNLKKKNLIEKWRAYIKKQIGSISNIDDLFPYPSKRGFSTTGRGHFSYLTDGPTKNREDLLECYHFFLEILKESVYNDRVNPLLGPPLMIIHFQPLYDNVVCVCESYNLRDRQMTYDVATGIPTTMSISFDLTEFKNSNVQDLIPKSSITESSTQTGYSRDFSDNNNNSMGSFKDPIQKALGGTTPTLPINNSKSMFDGKSESEIREFIKVNKAQEIASRNLAIELYKSNEPIEDADLERDKAEEFASNVQAAERYLSMNQKQFIGKS